MSHQKIRTFLVTLSILLVVWGGWHGARALNRTLTRTVNTYAQQALPGVTTIERVTALPWRLALRHVRWNVSAVAAEPVLEARRIILQPSMSAILIGRLIFSRVTIGDLVITLTRTAKGSWNFSAATPPHSATPSRATGVVRRFLSQGKLLVRRLEIVRGSVRFEDRAENPPIAMRIQDLRLVIQAMPMPQHLWAVRVFAEGKLRVRPDGRESPFRVTGWFDPVAKDVEAKFQVNDVELGPLEPYYQGRITKVRAYEGRLTLQGTADALANHLTIKCQAIFSHLTQGGISVLGRTIADVGGALNAVQGALTTEFVIHGPLDNPIQWTYQLGPNQAPLILLFLPFMKPNGEKTVIDIGPAQLDVGQAVQHWMGSDALAPAPGVPSDGAINATPAPDHPDAAPVAPPEPTPPPALPTMNTTTNATTSTTPEPAQGTHQ